MASTSDKNMSGKQNGMILRNLPNQIPDFQDLVRAQTICRFIQHHQFRVMHNAPALFPSAVDTPPKGSSRAAY